MSPEELAQLPSLDALTAATDLTPFLRAGVPRALRNAALRRMWSVDPAIRDFVSEAREYAYDWNTPGGVPGTGGAISAEDVRAMVEKVFGGGEETPPSADSDEAGISENGALLPSPRGRGEGFTPLAGGEASREPQVRREGEGVSTSETVPVIPPPPTELGLARVLHPSIQVGHARLGLGEGGLRSRPGEGQRDADPEGALHHGRDFSGSGVPSPGPLRGPPSPAEGGGENLRLFPSPDSPVPTGIGIAHQTPQFSSVAESGRNHPEPPPEPPSPPRLRRHGGALPI